MQFVNMPNPFGVQKMTGERTETDNILSELDSQIQEGCFSWLRYVRGHHITKRDFKIRFSSCRSVDFLELCNMQGEGGGGEESAEVQS